MLGGGVGNQDQPSLVKLDANALRQGVVVVFGPRAPVQHHKPAQREARIAVIDVERSGRARGSIHRRAHVTPAFLIRVPVLADHKHTV
jgi:hypothetical protein